MELKDFKKAVNKAIAKTTDIVVDATTKATDYLDKRFDVLIVKKQMEDVSATLVELYAEYGLFCYSETNGTIDDSFREEEEIISDIALAETELEVLEDQYRELTAKTNKCDCDCDCDCDCECKQAPVDVFCSNCGAKHTTDENFCNKCGHELKK